MDATRFDRLTKAMVGHVSRRRLLGGLGGVLGTAVATAGIGGATGEAARKRGPSNPCLNACDARRRTCRADCDALTDPDARSACEHDCDDARQACRDACEDCIRTCDNQRKTCGANCDDLSGKERAACQRRCNDERKTCRAECPPPATT